MSIRFSRAIALLLAFTAAGLALLSRLPGHAMTSPAAQPPAPLVATASGPPRLVTEILNGEPIAVLYVTRADDAVLVRCYPGYAPNVRLRAMGRNPEANDSPQEGILSCAQPSDRP